MEHALCTVGNAILDVLQEVDETTLDVAGLDVGTMTLVDHDGLSAVLSLMQEPVERAGGSAANTARGYAALGGRATFVGKVAADDAGMAYAEDLARAGVSFGTTMAPDAVTAHSAILVGPDGERTMATHLGACLLLSEDDMVAAMASLEGVRYVFAEGYLWDAPSSHLAALRTVETAKRAGVECAITLSDPGCATRWQSSFTSLIRNGYASVVFANEHEFVALWPNNADLSRPEGTEGATIVVTRGSKGCKIFPAAGQGEVFDFPAVPVRDLVDTTGAGDMFAAGYLRGLAETGIHRKAAAVGCLLAANVIMHRGAVVRLSDDDRLRIDVILTPDDETAETEAA